MIDRVPRELSADQLEALKALSRLVVNELELRRSVGDLSKAVRERRIVESELDQLFNLCRTFFVLRDSTDISNGSIRLGSRRWEIPEKSFFRGHISSSFILTIGDYAQGSAENRRWRRHVLFRESFPLR